MNLPANKVEETFFCRDVLDVAPDLVGKYLVVNTSLGKAAYMITEVEAYKGEEDKACHASKGRTARTEIMYHKGGHIYVYLIYGMYMISGCIICDITYNYNIVK